MRDLWIGDWRIKTGYVVVIALQAITFAAMVMCVIAALRGRTDFDTPTWAAGIASWAWWFGQKAMNT